MKIKFADIIKITKKSCGNNIAMIYSVPCELDKGIAGFMSSFGKPKFDLDTIKFLHIDSADDYTIKGRLEKTSINFSVPKKSKNVGMFGAKKAELENNIVKWLEHRLGISIER
jgi:hypothetical protein